MVAPLTDRDLATLSAAAYTLPPTWRAGDVHACLTWREDCVVIAVRGTEPDNVEDWLRDFDVMPETHPGFGECHAGFLDGALGLWQLIQDEMPSLPVVLTGHSMGGAICVPLGGLMILAGHKPAALVTFGAPRVAGDGLVAIWRPIPARQYRDGNDRVPTEPWWFDHAREPLVAVGKAAWNWLDCHEIDRYAADVPPVPALAEG